MRSWVRSPVLRGRCLWAGGSGVASAPGAGSARAAWRRGGRRAPSWAIEGGCHRAASTWGGWERIAGGGRHVRRSSPRSARRCGRTTWTPPPSRPGTRSSPRRIACSRLPRRTAPGSGRPPWPRFFGRPAWLLARRRGAGVGAGRHGTPPAAPPPPPRGPGTGRSSLTPARDDCGGSSCLLVAPACWRLCLPCDLRVCGEEK